MAIPIANDCGDYDKMSLMIAGLSRDEQGKEFGSLFPLPSPSQSSAPIMIRNGAPNSP